MYIDLGAVTAFIGVLLGAFTLFLNWLFLYHGILLFKSWTLEKPKRRDFDE